MTTRKINNISVITSIGTKTIIYPSYDYIHYLSDSGLPLSRLVKNGSTFRYKGEVVVKKPHELWDFVRASLLLLGILMIIGYYFWLLL